jgi:zinc protease
MPRPVVIALLFASPLVGQLANLPIEHYELPNGVKVILQPDHKAPVVHVNLRFRVGSKQEPPGHNGYAHLYEHLLFVDGYLARSAELGSTGANGSTAYDYTEYYETVPASHLERMLWMESNRFANFTKAVKQTTLDRQRDVVRNEIHGHDNETDRRVDREKQANIFPAGHPYQHDSLGSDEDIRAANLEDAIAFYNRYYTSDRLTIVLAGDLDPAQVKPWIAKYFGSMVPGVGVADAPIWVPRLSAPKLVEMRDRVQTERINFAWPAPGEYSRDDAALDLAVFILTDGAYRLNGKDHSRQFKGVAVGREVLQDASIFTIGIDPQPEATLEQVQEGVNQEIARLVRDGPQEEELSRARNDREYSQISGLEGLYDRARALQDVAQDYGGIEHWREWAERFSRLTAKDVKEAVGRWLTTPNLLVMRIRPLPARPDAATEPNRSEAPPLQPDKPYRTPEIRTAKLNNGLEIYVVERHDLPMVSVQLDLRAGNLDDPPDKPALAGLAAALLTKGTSTRDDGEIEKEQSRIATRIYGNSELNTAMGFQTMRKNLEPAFELLADLVRNPTYPKWAVDHTKDDWIKAYQRPHTGIDDFLGYVNGVFFGDNHPLGRNGSEAVERFRTVTARDVAAFHKRRWNPDVAALFLCGDVTLDEAVALASKSLGDWKGTTEARSAIPPAKPKAGRVFLVDRKGSKQTMVVQVVPAIPVDHPDFLALSLADKVLGDGSTGRLRRNIRGEKAMAYWAVSGLATGPGYGLWMASSPVQADKTGVAITEFAKELRGIGGERPITAQEFESARDQATQEYTSQFDTIRSIVDVMSGQWWTGRPVLDARRIPERIASVSIAEANAAARKYARPDAAILLLVGDRETIEHQIEALGLGKVVVLED